MKTFLLFLVFSLMVSFFSGPTFGQDFNNVKVNHLTDGRQSMWGSHSLQVHSNNIYALWTDMHDDANFSYVSKSTDGGATFDDGVNVSSEGIQIFSSMTMDDDGNLYVTWVGTPDGEAWNGIYFAKSTDGGATFSEQVAVSPSGGFPKIAVYGDHVYILFINFEMIEGKGFEEWPASFEFARSTNGGATFEEPFQLNDVELTGDDIRGESPCEIYVDVDGTIYAVWGDGRDREDDGLDIFLSKSVNDGVDFSANAIVNNPDLFPGQQRFMPAITTHDNLLYVAWFTENIDDSNGQIHIASSSDGGAIFSEEKMVTFSLGNFGLAVSEQGNLHIGYHGYKGEGTEGVYHTYSTDGGKTFGEPLYISEESASTSGVFIHIQSGLNEVETLSVLWADDRDGEYNIYFAKDDVDILPTGLVEITAEQPAHPELRQNYPNPFNPGTQIRFSLPKHTHVNLTVYDMLGQRAATLVNETRSPGWHDVTFDASGLSSGLYIYRLEAGDFVETRNMMFVK